MLFIIVIQLGHDGLCTCIMALMPDARKEVYYIVYCVSYRVLDVLDYDLSLYVARNVYILWLKLFIIRCTKQINQKVRLVKA